MQTLELEKLGLAPISEDEIQDIDGGGWKAYTMIGLATVVGGPLVGGFMLLGYTLG